MQKFLKLLKNLKFQLIASSMGVVIMLLVTIYLITTRHTLSAVILIVFACFYLIALNFWFWQQVNSPIETLTYMARKIADGRYGIKTESIPDNEIGELACRINEMSEKVAIAEKYRTEFISQVSHELRTPLTAIEGWAETIAYDPSLEGDSLRGINIISKEAERLTGMVTEMLEFARMQDGRFNLRMELIDIAEELEDSIFTYRELLKQADIELSYTLPDNDIPLIPGDPERLKQVFLNLLDNAAKHGGDGKKITVALKETNNGVIITVRDFGHGVPENELPRIKEKFYKGSSKNRGTGIGLAVSDEIISRHGGRLDIANAEGGGCLVTIYLPGQNGE